MNKFCFKTCNEAPAEPFQPFYKWHFNETKPLGSRDHFGSGLNSWKIFRNGFGSKIKGSIHVIISCKKKHLLLFLVYQNITANIQRPFMNTKLGCSTTRALFLSGVSSTFFPPHSFLMSLKLDDITRFIGKQTTTKHQWIRDAFLLIISKD